MRGSGHPLVLVHGGLVDSRMWDEQFEVFSQQYKVVRYDLRGFGRSQIPKEPFSPIEDLNGLMAFLKLDKVHLVGLSFGGSLVIEFTLAHPAMVDCLILASSDVRGYPPTPPDEITLKIIDAVRQRDQPETVVELMLNHPVFATAKNNPVAQQRIRMMLMDNYETWTSGSSTNLSQWPSAPAIKRLSEIQNPTLILIGNRDTPDILAIADILEAGIVGAKKRVLSGAGHHMNMEKPDEFNRLVLDFLNMRSSKN